MDQPTIGERVMQDRLGTGERADQFYRRQVLDHLNDRMCDFLSRQETMYLATSDAAGECDNSFRGGPSGFVRVLDRNRLTWPEYRGNGVLASLGNIVENPHVGLLFVDFTDAIGLHVNGTAAIVEDLQMRDRVPGLPVDPSPGRQAEVWVVAWVKEAYIHCSKRIPRMRNAPSMKKTDYFVEPAAATSLRRV